MEKVIKIGTKDVALQANAATPIRYRNLFKKDLLTLISEGTRDNGVEMTVASEVAPELIMTSLEGLPGEVNFRLSE